MKILLLDIESAPNVVHVWGLWQQNVGLPQILESGYVLCWSAKWLGEKEVMFDSVHQSSHKTMLKKIHKLLDEADVVVHYNGKKFDIPTLNKEFVLHGMNPPAPFKQVDLYQVAKSQFKFASNKLTYISKQMGLGEKYLNPHGHELWINCMEGDEEAWEIMQKYNKQDVILLEKLYIKLLPWIKNHPAHGTYQEDKQVCPACGGSHYHRRGYAHAKLLVYPRFQCQDCGKWFKSNKTVSDRGMEMYVDTGN